MKTKFLVGTLLCLLNMNLSAQTQTVRGVVVDKIAQSPIPGATIVVLNLEPVIHSQSDEEGKFNLSTVPVGNQSFLITYSGYKEVILQNIPVNAGKELVLTVNMEEEIDDLDEVVVTAKVEKNKPLNELSTVSTRTFSVEETQRFAAAVNDPARMASSFAGVVTAGDCNNHISIRGNSQSQSLLQCGNVRRGNFHSQFAIIEQFRFFDRCVRLRIRKCTFRSV